eukprot:gb/GEZN01013562.1/.p1 GENE.gb/GEZN01013562.1/~~gb/GEZN01013562.1/.p1  ORF type:complete len:204 (+),score=37.19 gb/GEZN01013562.1/:103-714(+)
MPSQDQMSDLAKRTALAEDRLATLTEHYKQLAAFLHLGSSNSSSDKPPLLRTRSKMEIKSLDVVNSRSDTTPSVPLWTDQVPAGSVFPPPPAFPAHRDMGVLVWCYDSRGLLEPCFHWFAANKSGQSFSVSQVLSLAQAKTKCREAYRVQILGRPDAALAQGMCYLTDQRQLQNTAQVTIGATQLTLQPEGQPVPNSILVCVF